jgi:D-arabinose 1-dehydrogenase-like Zn-dependent alcohol dehydrogenase
MSKGTYRAVQAIGGGQVKLVERELPTPGPDEVRIRVEACGVCHTDVLTVEGGFPGLTHPCVPGHEVVGRVDAVGENVTRWTIGQRVGVGFLGGPCGVCAQCRRGSFVNCLRQPLTGLHRDGGWAEAMLVRESGLVAIADDISSVDAAPLLCAGITTFKALRDSTARPGDVVAIQGLGGLGHLAVQFSRAMGFRTIAVARGAEKGLLAKKLGAHHYVDSSSEDVAEALGKFGGASAIIATVSSPKAMSPLVAGLAPRGRMVVVGAGAEPLEVSTATLLFGERAIVGTNTGSTIEAEDTLDFALLQNIRPTVETMPLEAASEAYARVMRGEARFRMVLTM